MMAMEIDHCHDHPVGPTIGQRVETLERSVRELSGMVESLSETLALCLAYVEQIEAIDKDTMRLVSMYAGYSEGE